MSDETLNPEELEPYVFTQKEVDQLIKNGREAFLGAGIDLGASQMVTEDLVEKAVRKAKKSPDGKGAILPKDWWKG